MNNKGDIHTLWAPPGATWTPWVKPVLFAQLDEERATPPLASLPAWVEPEVITPLERSTLESAAEQHPYRKRRALADVAAVVDLPGADGALAGVALAQYGFRPIPLYNAMLGPSPVVEVQPIMDVLAGAAEGLATLPLGAPPAFLLDAGRMGKDRPRDLGHFDNRSVCFSTDFPSATALRSAGIRRAVLIHAGSDRPAVDLAETLVQWQEQGIAFFVARPDIGAPAEPRTLTRPSWLRRLFQAFQERNLYYNQSGGFGALLQLPQRTPSTSSG